uniref:Uncharacterized protein LOC104238337 n=1 Tax=Nicotiana sylvestris TaxID=4096 RepID=A0A1U7XVI9_NICSY|nr:PREDICTED: uncharacterized protein LOC104238337 [Nicotiana sylvestris]
MTSDVYPKVYAAVYSTKNDSWKFLEPEHTHLCQICISQNCTYMNGVYYWISTSQRFCKEDNVYFIRTFDFATELFGEMTGPPIPGEHWASLMLRGGSLAAMSCDDVTQAMTANYGIWVRIRENNWIKAYTVNPPIPSHYPIGIWEYDKFIFELTQTCRLVFYDQTVKQVTSLGFHFYDLSCGSNWAISYKESLVPIKNEKPTDKDNAEYFLTKNKATNPKVTPPIKVPNPGMKSKIFVVDTGMILVSTPFDGHGYAGWSRSILISLSTKNKLGFTDGSYPMPAPTDPTY